MSDMLSLVLLLSVSISSGGCILGLLWELSILDQASSINVAEISATNAPHPFIIGEPCYYCAVLMEDPSKKVY